MVHARRQPQPVRVLVRDPASDRDEPGCKSPLAEGAGSGAGELAVRAAPAVRSGLTEPLRARKLDPLGGVAPWINDRPLYEKPGIRQRPTYPLRARTW